MVKRANSVLDYALKDPLIKIDEFNEYYNMNVQLANQSKSEDRNVTINREFMGVRFSVGDNADLRTVKRNPGVTKKPSFVNDRLRAETTEILGEYEVFVNNTIPYRIYDEMDKDETILLGRVFTTGVISSLAWTIDSESPKVSAVIERLYKRHHKPVVTSMIQNTFKYGFTLAEKIWQRENIVAYNMKEGKYKKVYDGEATGLKKIKFQDPKLDFKYFKDRNDEITKIKQVQAKGEVSVNRSKLLWFALDKENSNVFGASRYKQAYEKWYFQDMDFQWITKHLEKYGSPYLEGRYPMGTTTLVLGQPPVNNSQIIVEAANSLSSFGSYALSSERDEKGHLLWSLDFKEPKDISIEPHIQFQDMCDSKKLMALGIVPEVIMSSNFSEKDAAIDLQMHMFGTLVDQIESVIQQDIIDYLVAYNFGDEYVSQVTFNIDRKSLQNSLLMKDLFKEIFRLYMSKDGVLPSVMPDLAHIMDELNLPWVSSEETFVVDENAPKEKTTTSPNPAKDQQNIDDSNGRNRKTPDTRDRGRVADRKSATDT